MKYSPDFHRKTRIGTNKFSALARLSGFFIVLSILASCREKELPAGDADRGGLFLPDHFEALVVADSTGSGRHLAVTDDGDIYMKFRSSPSQGMVAIRVNPQTGKAQTIERFGGYNDTGNNGTASRIYNGHLYFSTSGEVYRVRLTPGKLIPEGKVDTMLIDDYKHDKHGYEHIAKPIAFDDEGNLFVQYGAPGDACQVMNRIPGSPGEEPCSQLIEHAGVWKFDANKTGQTQKDGKRYATGIRSIVGMDWNKQDNSLYVVVHGRDNLHSTWPEIFTPWQSAVLPSEEFLRIKEGADGGWPYYYYDQMKSRRMLSPEYGGDGVKEGKGREYIKPLIGFPAHWAPNDLLFYTGDQFPKHYKDGAFIAFHGSTNRAPYPQSGYFIAFVPFEKGEPAGQWEVFADGFGGVDPIVNVSDAKYRPMAIAMGPDGSLYLSETNKGKIWRVMFKGSKGSFGKEHLLKMEERKSLSHIRTPDPVNDNLQKGEVSTGEMIYGTYCAPCHQTNGLGAEGRFPSLAKTEWVMKDKDRLIKILLTGMAGSIVVNGVPYNGVMPRHSFLSDSELESVLTYVRQNFGNQASPITAEEIRQLRDSQP